ncbi:MAG: hypothetical protein AAGE59_05905 [Cyanobacteria bacterium P01_F01_bin.86]
MNSYSKPSNATLLDLQRQHLEELLNHSTNTAYSWGRLRQLLAQLGAGMANWLTNGSMPKVSIHKRGGVEFWRVYDPMAKTALQFDNEDALRIWLEQRYYR